MDLRKVLKFAEEQEASDVIITADAPPVLRIHGDLRYLDEPPLKPDESRRTVYGILDEEKIAQFERRNELDFSLELRTGQRFRVNVFVQRGAVGAAFRLIRSRIPTLEELGLPPILEEFALARQGLIIVTGPTGHGKSTTQAAMIDIINRRCRRHIVTIEDPIEFLHVNRDSVIEQREVGQDTKSFASALRHVLRQAPDVILIGEMRDPETVAAAMTAAETGHLVITTLHTNDAVQSVDRILDSFPPHHQPQVRSQLAFCLLAVIAQRLLPTADGQGRVVAVEILRNIPAVAHLIREAKVQNLYTIMETHAREGMITMDASVKRLFLEGRVTYEEAISRVRHPELLRVREPVARRDDAY